jgi:DNA-directed RNA polymerase subunit RPC12/RpoP
MNKHICVIQQGKIKNYNKMEVATMMGKHDHATCPECGARISAKSYTLVCDYCLSKKED